MANEAESAFVQKEAPIERIARPFQEFARSGVSGGLLLLACTILALLWANSPWSSSYFALWRTKLTIGIPALTISKPLLLWINDGLMALFFFLVGLEIKRELLVGELASARKAALPIAGAIGGMLLPAAIYAWMNFGTAGARGWGVPMATDIAFALGVLALLGDRISPGLKIFLAALAIADDIGAVLVIAFFYTADISWISLWVAAGFFVALVIFSAAGARHPVLYALLGLGLWVGFLKSGVHATVAGVLAALTIPARARIDADKFVGRTQRIIDEFCRAKNEGEIILTSETQQSAVSALEETCEKVQTPMQRLEHGLLPWVNYFILPLFAFANAGVALGGNVGRDLVTPVALGVIAGLVLGKTVGIWVFARLAVWIGLAELPEHVNWRHISGVAMLGGVGFTMALFIAALAFGDDPLHDVAKIGIIVASLISGAAGYFILRSTPRPD